MAHNKSIGADRPIVTVFAKDVQSPHSKKMHLSINKFVEKALEDELKLGNNNSELIVPPPIIITGKTQCFFARAFSGARLPPAGSGCTPLPKPSARR